MITASTNCLPFSTNNDKIENVIANFAVPGNSGARLYDAFTVFRRGRELLRGRPDGQRRAIVVVGEASDSGKANAKCLAACCSQAQLANIGDL